MLCDLHSVAKHVITGQQIGLLGGPLYTTYKVLGAVKYAREIEGQAVYWLETNDADFEEINHLTYLDGKGEIRTLTWEKDSQGYSCGQIEIDTELMDLLNRFFDDLRQTEFTPELRVLALGCYVAGRTLGEASCLLAKQLFGRFGVKLFDPSQKQFKAFIKPYLLREAEQTRTGEQCNLFCMAGKKRMAVFKDDKGYHLRNGKRVTLEKYDLVPNVKTRNVCQDAYFKTHTYIAGPGEMTYIEDLDPQYEFHGVQKARVRPRMSVTLLEPKVMRLLKKHDLQLEDILESEKAELRKSVLKEETGFDYNALQQHAAQITHTYLSQLQEIGINLGKSEKNIHQIVKEALGTMRAEEKAKTERVLQAAEQLSDMLKPFGHKQERVFTLFYYMNLYGGLHFIEWLYDHYDQSIDTLEVTP